MVTNVPEVRYARNGGVALAYQLVGDGAIDVLFVPGFVSNIELNWELPAFARFLTRLASFARLIVIDRRGTGLSDPFAPDDLPSHETMVDDLRAVIDAAGAQRVAIFGFHEGGLLGALFAAGRPDRTSALVTFATAPSGMKTDAYPWQWSEEEWEPYLADMSARWGSRDYSDEVLRFVAPTASNDERVRSWWSRYCRLAASPTSATTIERIYSRTDICEILPAIHVPTLVLHPTSDQHEDVEGARYIAGRVPGARLVELAGNDAFPWGDNADALLAEIEEFLTGTRPVADPDRVLATVVFTDIVGSTDLVVTMGDRAWRDLLERHHDDVRRLLAEHRGREIDTAGDGFFATFDGPARAVRCADGIAASAAEIGLKVRAGVHTGEVELAGDEVRGIAVHVGARIAAAAGPSEVLVSATVKDLTAGSGLVFESAGQHELKGVPGDWHLYRVVRAQTLEGSRSQNSSA